MFVELRGVYDNTVNSLSVVLTDSQKESLFLTSFYEFFNWVQPIVKIPKNTSKQFDVKEGYKDIGDFLGLGIGAFEVKEVIKFDEFDKLRISPLQAGNFKIETSYIGDFQLVCKSIVKEVEQDNMQMMQGVGVESFQVEQVSLSEVREYLRKRYQISVAVIY
jgi:hypothetical protein